MAEPSLKVQARVMFEVVGNPKEYVEESLKGYVETLKRDPDLVFADEYIAEAEEKENLWSTFAEATITFPNLQKLTWMCINFTPSSVDILEPAHLHVEDKQLTDWYNDFISKLHELSMHHKSLTTENDLLKVNINHLIRNFLVSVLKKNPDGLSAEKLSEELGIHDLAALQPFLDTLVKDGKGAHTKGIYRLL